MISKLNIGTNNMENVQLIKKRRQGGYKDIFPRTFLNAIRDKESGVTLTEILQGFNMYFLSHTGSRESTRLQIPSFLRREGLWITYVLYDHTVITEWYNSEKIDDESWKSDSNWRVGSNALVGDISISSDGYWVINGIVSETKAQGEQGITPLLRIGDNNKLQVSYNEGKQWNDISDLIVPKFRWLQGEGTTAGTVQISMDLGKTWSNLSNPISNNLRIKKYIGINESLPTSGVEEGTIYMKGPYYAEDDTLNDNPIYRMWIYAWKDNTLAWQDNGEFTSITAGVVQETGDSETEVMSQKAVSAKLSELELHLVDASSYKTNFVGDFTKQKLSIPILQGNIIYGFADGTEAVALYNGESNEYIRVTVGMLPYVATFDSIYAQSGNGSNYVLVHGKVYSNEKKVKNLESRVSDIESEIKPTTPSTTKIVAIWVSGGEVSEFGGQISEYFYVKKGERISLNYGENNTIRWGIFAEIPTIGSTTETYGSQFTSAEIVADMDGYFMYSYYQTVTPVVFVSSGIFNKVINLEIGLENLESSKVSKKLSYLGNLFNPNAQGIIKGSYFTPSGVIMNNSELSISDYIPATPGLDYHISQHGDISVGNANMAIGLFDENKEPILFVAETEQSKTIGVGMESKVRYFRFSYRNAEVSTIQVEIGRNRSQYKPFNEVLEYFRNDAKRYFAEKKLESMTLTDVISFSEFPDGCKFGNSFSFKASISNGVSGLRLGWGYKEIGGNYIEIESDVIKVFKSVGTSDADQLNCRVIEHGLSLETYIKVVGQIDDDFVLHLQMMTLSGAFSVEIPEVGRWQGYNEDFRGTFNVYTGTPLTKVVASVANSRLAKPIWIFGDSYFTISEEIRPGYQLNKMGLLKNCFVQAFGGEQSIQAFERLYKALAYGRPQYIVFAEGMNGAMTLGASGYDYVYSCLNVLCEKLNIELILYAPPVPSKAAALPEDKQLISDFVRTTGKRFIDAYNAVGSNAEGVWFGQGTSYAYQNGDGVHTSVMGAKAIATQFLIDFPELMNANDSIGYL